MNSDNSGTPGLRRGSQRCECVHEGSRARLIAITGGPGAGKSAVLELAARSFCGHVVILPESATILFGGGFPRIPGVAARSAAQRAIFRVQRELERMALEDGRFAIILCDRGTLDGVAYWPGEPEGFWRDLETTREEELRRYAAVLHLETPTANDGYNHLNPTRIESPDEAHIIDLKTRAVWDGHPSRAIIPSSHNFPEKALHALEWLHGQLPPCCNHRSLSGG